MKVKSIRPEFTFGADVIVGFPTETENNFLQTLNLIKLCDFQMSTFFPIPQKKEHLHQGCHKFVKKIKKERVNILRSESNKILYDQLNKVIGKSTSILFESLKKSYTDEFFKVKLIESDEIMSRSGSLLNVKITSRQNDTLIAKIL